MDSESAPVDAAHRRPEGVPDADEGTRPAPVRHWKRSSKLVNLTCTPSIRLSGRGDPTAGRRQVAA